jgi:dihydroorotate dehydrogenase
MLRDPRAPERVVQEIARWCGANGVARISDLIGTLENPA